MTRQPRRATEAQTCRHCDQPIHPGDPIARRGGQWVHLGCATEGRE